MELFKFLKTKDEDRLFEGSKSLVRVFYYFNVFLTVVLVMRLRGYIGQENFEPFWLIEWWSKGLGLSEVVVIAQVGLLISAFIGALFYKKVWARILVFLSFIQLFGFFNSFEQISHEWYHMFYAMFFLTLLPDVWKKVNDLRKKSFITLVWASQAFVLLAYSMAGFQKLTKGIRQAFLGEFSWFSPESLSLIIAYWNSRFQRAGYFSEFIIEHHVIGWIGLIFITYVLLFAIVAAFRPTLHPIWATFIMFFHLGTYFSLGIIFIGSIGLLIVLFWLSPFYPKDTTIKDILRDLPLFGDVWKMFKFLKARYA